MPLSNEDFASQPPPEREQRPLVTDESGNEINPFEAEPEAGEEGDDRLPDDEFQSLPQNVRKTLRERAHKLAQLTGKLEASESQMTMLQQQMLELQKSVAGGNGKANGEPRTIKDWATGDLKAWKMDAIRIKARAAREPDNEAVQNEAAKISDTMIEAIDDELVDRRVEERVSERVGKFEERQAAGAREAQIMRMLASEGVPTDVLVNDSNEIRQQAAQDVVAVLRKLGLTQSDDAKAVAAYMALSSRHAASKKPAGRQQLPAAVMRQLDIEGAGRRVSASAAGGSAAKGGSPDGTRLNRITDWMIRNGMA